jgi:hypothetical protein
MKTNNTFNFPIWKTITIGKGRTGIGLLEEILAKFDKDAGNATSALKTAFTPHSKTETFDLVALEMHQVGFLPSGATANDFTARTIELDGMFKWAQLVGLEICPMEIGPQLRLDYPDQPEGEICLIAMEPIASGKQSPDQIFEVRHSLNCFRKCITKSLELTHATPFRYWSESSCQPGCERLLQPKGGYWHDGSAPPIGEEQNQPVETIRRLMVFIKPRKEEQQ